MKPGLFQKFFIRAFCVFCIFVVAAAVIAGKSTAGKKSRATPSPTPTPPPRVLVIGDSLSVGNFGKTLDDFLVSHFKREYVALYASCGSSPEDWLRAEPDFVTKCGYRERTKSREEYIDWQNGKPPRRVRTPKVEDLIVKHEPTVVVVQLGTNWMDGLAAAESLKEPKYRAFAVRFVTALFSSKTVRQVIWVTPPDSSHFSRHVQSTVYDIIRDAAGHRVQLIDSRKLTHYRSGVTGHDGIHYNNEESDAWARRAAGEMIPMLPDYESPARKSAD